MVRLALAIAALALVTTSAVADDCARPIRTSALGARVVYSVESGDTVCLSHQRKVRALSVTKRLVTLEAGRKIRKIPLGKAGRTVRLAGHTMSLRKKANMQNEIIIAVEIDNEPSPLCELRDSFTICTAEFAPVCGRDALGRIKMYTNRCNADIDCASPVPGEECGL